MKKIPRGIRNNNPLNIRKSNTQWVGKLSHNTDGTFEQFDTMEHGIRAGFVIIRTYIRKYNLRSIHKIIYRWAPPRENNTVEYIKTVCRRSGIEPDRELFFIDAKTMIKIVEAMIFVECGTAISEEIIRKAYPRD